MSCLSLQLWQNTKICTAAAETRNPVEKEQTVVSKKEEKQEAAGGWDIGDWKEEEDSQGMLHVFFNLEQ